MKEQHAVPGLEIEIPGFRFAIGEAFNKMIAFKYIKPTVVAVGLGEKAFSWVLRDEAAQMGSHKFVVIVGVPKGTSTIDFGMSAHVRMAKGVFGGFFGGGEIAGTEVKVVPISF